MKSFFLILFTMCLLSAFAGPLEAQETVIERLARLERNQEALARQLALNQAEVTKGLADIKAAIDKQSPQPSSSVSTDQGASLPSAGSVESSCGTSFLQTDSGLFWRLRERRAMRRGF